MRELCRTFLHRLAALFRHRHLEDDLDAELRSHIEMAIELNMRKGMSAETAKRLAASSKPKKFTATTHMSVLLSLLIAVRTTLSRELSTQYPFYIGLPFVST